MDLAATLEVRGFAVSSGMRGPAVRRIRSGNVARARSLSRRAATVGVRFSRHDYAFLVSAIALLGLALSAKLLGVDEFGAYPLIHAPVSAGTLVLCVALLAAVLLPFCDRRGVEL
jgi:hypothetical protein